MVIMEFWIEIYYVRRNYDHQEMFNNSRRSAVRVFLASFSLSPSKATRSSWIPAPLRSDINHSASQFWNKSAGTSYHQIWNNSQIENTSTSHNKKINLRPHLIINYEIIPKLKIILLLNNNSQINLQALRIISYEISPKLKILRLLTITIVTVKFDFTVLKQVCKPFFHKLWKNS
jgi:hypothetical protein